MGIKQWIRNWLNDDGVLLKGARVMEVDSSPSDQTGISISNAINGKVLTLRTYQPSKNNRSDWLTELYIVPEGESLTEAITILLLAKGLK
jgi:hypothetical protein